MKLFSTEQVSKWHPDKYADQISDSIVALAVSKNKNARVAVETMVKDDIVIVAGEVGNVKLFKNEINNAIKNVASTLNYKVNKIINYIGQQSRQINNAVDNEIELGAGDQGMVFGYATNETKSYLPYGFDLANKIITIIENDVDNNSKTILKGDAKTQVTIDLDTQEVHTILVSACHKEKLLHNDVIKYIIELLVKNDIKQPKEWLINPAGIWTVGGATADSGLTGRKIVADQYGGYTAVGGGAFSGKDLSKVDRSGAYTARNIAVDMLSLFKIKTCEIQIGYAIGVAKPISVYVKTNDSNKDEIIEEYIKHNYDLRPKSMIDKLGNIDYVNLASGCHYKKGKI